MPIEIKRLAKELGADLCGIASIERFDDAPSGFHPTDILKECKSVIVMALRFPVSTLSASSQAAYTFPAKALDGTTIEQRKCREVSAKYTEGGGFVYVCNLCRKICPNCKEII